MLYESSLRKALTKKETYNLEEVIKKAKQYIIIEKDVETYRVNMLEYEHQKCSYLKMKGSTPSLKKRNIVWKSESKKEDAKVRLGDRIPISLIGCLAELVPRLEGKGYM